MASALSAASMTLTPSTAPALPLTPTLLFHQLVWKDDLSGLQSLITQQADLRSQLTASTSQPTSAAQLYDINSMDIYGNTPLLLAIQLGRYEATRLLLASGAQTKYRNAALSSAIAESLSRGDRQLLHLVVETWSDRSEAEFHRRSDELMRRIEAVGDMQLSIGWKFSSWVPLLGRVLPGDEWRVWKKGNKLRIDTHLVDFSKSTLSWKHGSLSFLFELERHDGAAKQKAGKGKVADGVGKLGNITIYVQDHIHKAYAKLSKDNPPASTNPASSSSSASAAAPSEEEKEELEDRLDELMSAPIVTVSSPGEVQFVRAKSGIWGWRSDRTEEVNGYNSRVWDVKNINVRTEKRVEHMSEEEIVEVEELDRVLEQAEEGGEQKQVEEIERRLQEQLTIEDGQQHEEGADGEEEAEQGGEGAGEAEAEEGERRVIVAGARGGEDGASKTEGEARGSDMVQVIEEPRTLQRRHHRHSLPPPPPPTITYDEYFSATNRPFPPVLLHSPSTPSHPLLPPPCLSRPHHTSASTRSYSATLWLTDEFPLPLSSIITILDLIAPHQRHVAKLRDFIEQKLPPGFPVKIKMPIFPTVTAEVSFLEYSEAEVDDAAMVVPSDYVEDPSRFAKLLKVTGQTEEEQQQDAQ